MKIAVDCRMIGSGGIGTYFLSILPYLMCNFECLLFGNEKIIKESLEEIIKRNFSSGQLPPYEIIPCKVTTFSFTELLFFPSSLLKIINSCDAYYTPYCNIPKGITIPIYSTIHDVVFLDIPEITSKLGFIVRKWFYQRAMNKSAAVFTVSNFSAERIKEHLKVRNKPIIVTYNAVPEWFTNESFFDDAGKENILFVGNIKHHKGLHILVPAFKKAVEAGLKAKLIIVGNAENFRTGDSTILSEISGAENILFTGKVTDEKLRMLYRNSALLVQPSLYEGFGMPPMEALACGTNVILSDIPVFKEIYKDFPVTFFKSGDIDDLAEKLLKKYDSPSPPVPPDIYSFEKTSKIIINQIIGSNLIQEA